MLQKRQGGRIWRSYSYNEDRAGGYGGVIVITKAGRADMAEL